MMDANPDWLAQALLAHCPAPMKTREWHALTEHERGIWVRYAVTVMRAQAERLRQDLQRDLAEARRPQPDPGRERSPEERALMLARALQRYARHLDGCPQAPCSCGLAALLG